MDQISKDKDFLQLKAEISFISFNNICYTLDKIRRGILSYYIKNQYLHCLLCHFVVCLTYMIFCVINAIKNNV